LGRLLSLARFLFIAAFPKRFDTTVIAELRGYIDQEGRSPFWEAVGKHFFENEFSAIDGLSGIGDKRFIADLMPRHPLYLTLLPPAVQAVIGKVHHDTQPALTMLLEEGFARTNEIDIFDAGPLLQARASEIRTVRNRQVSLIAAIIPDGMPASDVRLVANDRLDFRTCLSWIDNTSTDGVGLPQAAATALKVGVGDKIAHAMIS
jgi:arginine N-succinyltransferase